MANGTIAVALAAALLAAWAVLAYNRLVRLRNQVRKARADVDVQLISRHDLVPALVSAVQAYAGGEQAVLSAVTGLRAQAIATRAPATPGTIEAALEQGVGRLLASGGRASRR